MFGRGKAKEPRTETLVREYKNTKEYQRDANKLAKDDWTVQNVVSQEPGNIFNRAKHHNYLGMKDQIIVTYTRTRA